MPGCPARAWARSYRSRRSAPILGASCSATTPTCRWRFTRCSRRSIRCASRAEDIRPNPEAIDEPFTRGYIAAPIESVFARAPYLHNASVLTLAELINLEPRRDVFYRGRNLYDPVAVGFVSPSAPDALRYFEFDTSRPGNSNAGHDYPWPYDSPDRDEAQLRDLLEFLRSF